MQDHAGHTSPRANGEMIDGTAIAVLLQLKHQVPDGLAVRQPNGWMRL